MYFLPWLDLINIFVAEERSKSAEHECKADRDGRPLIMLYNLIPTFRKEKIVKIYPRKEPGNIHVDPDLGRNLGVVLEWIKPSLGF